MGEELTTHDLKENYFALILAVERGETAERALSEIEGRQVVGRPKKQGEEGDK